MYRVMPTLIGDNPWDASFHSLYSAKEYSERVYEQLREQCLTRDESFHWVYLYDMITHQMIGHWSGIGWVAYTDVKRWATAGSMWIYESSSNSSYNKTISADDYRPSNHPNQNHIRVTFNRIRSVLMAKQRQRYMSGKSCFDVSYGYCVASGFADRLSERIAEGINVIYHGWMNGDGDDSDDSYDLFEKWVKDGGF